MASARPRIQLIFDFDGTITKADTTAVIGSRVLDQARKLAAPNASPNELPKPMEFYSEQYMQEYRNWKDTYVWPHGERKTVQDVVSYLSTAKDVERNSFLRVRSAVLQTPGGIVEVERDEDMRNELMTAFGREAVRSGEVKIREPDVLHSLITMAEQGSNGWGIVSVSWSRRFILGVLLQAGMVREGEEKTVAGKILCNELLTPIVTDGDGMPTVICTAQDKLDALGQLLQEYHAAEDPNRLRSSDHDDSILSIYVGDSTTDIGCLAGSSLGFYLGDGHATDPVINTLAGMGVSWLSVEDLPTSGVLGRFNRSELGSDQHSKISMCHIQSLSQLRDWLERVT